MIFNNVVIFYLPLLDDVPQLASFLPLIAKCDNTDQCVKLLIHEFNTIFAAQVSIRFASDTLLVCNSIYANSLIEAEETG